MRNKIVQAMDSKFRADLMAADAKLQVYLENPVGVGEHPNIPEECAKLVAEICEATERVKYVQKLYLDQNEEDANEGGASRMNHRAWISLYRGKNACIIKRMKPQ